MAFWGEGLDALSRDPKRKFRFKVSFGGADGDSANKVIWWAKSVDKPKMTIESQEHKFMGHTFKYPGSVKGEDVNLTLVDPVEPNAAAQTLEILKQAGYLFPEPGYAGEGSGAFQTINKGKSVAAVGTFRIEQLDGDGNAVEVWELHNPFFTSVQFSELSYDSEELSDIQITVMYDWAKFYDPADSSTDYKFKFPS